METKILTCVGGEQFTSMTELVSRTAVSVYSPNNTSIDYPYAELEPVSILGIPGEQWISPDTSSTKIVTGGSITPQIHLAEGQDPATGVELRYYETTIAAHIWAAETVRVRPININVGGFLQNTTDVSSDSYFQFYIYQNSIQFAAGGTYLTASPTLAVTKPAVVGSTYWFTIRLQSGVVDGDPGKYFGYVNGTLVASGTWEASKDSHQTLDVVKRVTEGGAGAYYRNIMSFSGWTSNEDELPKNYRVTEVRANNVTGPVTGVGGTGTPGDNLVDGDDDTYVQMTGGDKTMTLSHTGSIDPDLDAKEVVGVLASTKVSRSSIAYTPISMDIVIDGTPTGTGEALDVSKTAPDNERLGPITYTVPEGSDVTISDIAISITSDSY